MNESLRKTGDTWQLVAKRSLSQWKLLSSLVLGVLLASAIMAGTVVYFDALREMALRRTLDKLSTSEVNILAKVERGPTNQVEYDLVEEMLTEQFDLHVDWLLRDRIRAGKTATFFLTPPGREELAGADNARTYFAFIPRLSEHAALLQGGKLPDENALSAPGEPLLIEALVPFEASQLYGIGVGDRFSAVPHWEDAVPHVSVIVSGIVRKNDPSAEIWYLDEAVLNAATGPSFNTVPFYISESAYTQVLGPAFRSMDSEYAWLLAVDPDRVNAGNSQSTHARMRAMELRLATLLPSYNQVTALDHALIEYDRRIFFSKLPMFVVLILIAVVVLYYVATLSSLAVEQRRGEVALLRSRGATSAQILAVFVMEGATIAVLAVVLGPLIAAFAVSILGLTPAFSGLSDGASVAVTISRDAYLMSALGGVLSFAALIIPAVRASRIGVTQQRQEASRPARSPVLQRYYVDVLLLLVSIVLFRQLTEQGSVAATNLFGEVVVDQLLLIVPGLMLVAAAMVLLRLFPLTMSLVSRLLSPWLPADLALGVWQMARNPTHYARLSLLIILTAGLGIFASSFGATLELSFEQRVLHETGSSVRVVGAKLNTKCIVRGHWRGTCHSEVPIGGPARLDEAFEKIEGVRVATQALRTRGQDLSKTFGHDYEMLAMNVDTAAEVAWFRDDFSDTPMADLLASLKAPNGPRGIVLPDDARTVGIRMKADRSQPGVRVTARIKNAQGRYSTYILGNIDSSDWMVLSEDLDFRIRQSPEFDIPIEIVSIGVHETGAGRKLRAGSIIIDDIRVTNARGETVIVEPFDDTSQWEVMRVSSAAATDVFAPTDLGADGGGSGLLSWSDGSALTNRGIFRAAEPVVLPVLASRQFSKVTGHSQGDEFDVSVSGHRVPVRIVETVNMFPTMNTLSKRFLVADLSSLTDYANMGAMFRELRPNEMWLSTEAAGEERRELVETLQTDEAFLNDLVFDRAERFEDTQVDPLVGAGWRALLFLAFAAVLILSCLGFLVHAYVSFQSRQLQFALLRTVGFSLRQLLTMVWLEQVLVIAVGMALGTWMGGRLGATIMPFLGHDDFGAQVVPPFVVRINWGALLITYGVMVVVFAAVVMGLLVFIRRTSLQRILRMGEM